MRLRYAPLWLSALVLTSCGDVFGPDATEYCLVQIDGRGLPYQINFDDPSGLVFPQHRIERGGLSLHENGEYDILVSGSHYSYFEGTWEPFRNSHSGRYTITADTIRFQNEMGESSTSHPYGWFEDGRLHTPVDWFCTCEWTFEEIT